jgi:thiamine pyrophosphate-dependent acetolactate synthase large subunit-like protein
LGTIVERERVAIDAGATGAQYITALLAAQGVDTAFGVPGVHTLALYDALRDSPIRHVLPRHEQGAGFMADGFARASGLPGVAFVITGPGVTNIATPLGQARTDSSPVLLISSNVERPYLDDMRGNLHDLRDQMAVTRAVTKWNGRAMSADAIPTLMTSAFEQLLSGRPSPVHLEFPLDVLDETLPAGATFDVVDRSAECPSQDLIDRASELLGHASRLVIYLGGGAVASPAPDAIITLAERLGAPVLTSVMGKGAIPEDHPLCLGTHWGPGNVVDDLLSNADCMLVVGSKLGHQMTWGFQLPLPRPLIRIEIDPREMHLNAKPDVPLLGDAAATLRALVDRLSLNDVAASGRGFDPAEIRRVRAEAERTAWHAERRPYVDALRRAVPRDGITVMDMTQLAYVAWWLYPVYEPRTFLFPAGYGTLGFALPAAIGAKIAKPDRTVVAVAGDGGFQFTMAELGCAIQERLGIPIVIFNDSTYSAVKEAQMENRGGRYIAVDLENPDYVALAAAYGIPGVRSDSPEAMESAIVEAASRDVPTIIDVPIAPFV